MISIDVVRGAVIDILAIAAIALIIFAVYHIRLAHKMTKKLDTTKDKMNRSPLTISTSLLSTSLCEDIVIPMGRVCIVDVSPNDVLNVRSGHSEKSPVVNYVENDDIVVVYEIAFGYGRINSPAGWVDMKYLKDVSSAG